MFRESRCIKTFVILTHKTQFTLVCDCMGGVGSVSEVRTYSRPPWTPPIPQTVPFTSLPSLFLLFDSSTNILQDASYAEPRYILAMKSSTSTEKEAEALPPTTIKECVERAKRAFALKKYEQAVELYANALEIMYVTRPFVPCSRLRCVSN